MARPEQLPSEALGAADSVAAAWDDKGHGWSTAGVYIELVSYAYSVTAAGAAGLARAPPLGRGRQPLASL